MDGMRRSAALFAITYVGLSASVPILHGASEDLGAGTTIEQGHGVECSVVHDDATCRLGQFEQLAQFGARRTVLLPQDPATSVHWTDLTDTHSDSLEWPSTDARGPPARSGQSGSEEFH